MVDVKNINKIKKKKKLVSATVRGLLAKAVPAKKEYVESIGRRKTSVARVRLYKALKNTINVNGKDAGEFFGLDSHTEIIKDLFSLSGDRKFSIVAYVKGGGQNAQAESIRLGFARSLIKIDPDLRTVLKEKGYLKRDPRSVERKKFGLKKARKAPTWVKR